MITRAAARAPPTRRVRFWICLFRRCVAGDAIPYLLLVPQKGRTLISGTSVDRWFGSLFNRGPSGSRHTEFGYLFRRPTDAGFWPVLLEMNAATNGPRHFSRRPATLFRVGGDPLEQGASARQSSRTRSSTSGESRPSKPNDFRRTAAGGGAARSAGGRRRTAAGWSEPLAADLEVAPLELASTAAASGRTCRRPSPPGSGPVAPRTPRRSRPRPAVLAQRLDVPPGRRAGSDEGALVGLVRRLVLGEPHVTVGAEDLGALSVGANSAPAPRTGRSSAAGPTRWRPPLLLQERPGVVDLQVVVEVEGGDGEAGERGHRGRVRRTGTGESAEWCADLLIAGLRDAPSP